MDTNRDTRKAPADVNRTLGGGSNSAASASMPIEVTALCGHTVEVQFAMTTSIYLIELTLDKVKLQPCDVCM